MNVIETELGCQVVFDLSVKEMVALKDRLTDVLAAIELRQANTKKELEEALLKSICAAVKKAHGVKDGDWKDKDGKFVPMPMRCFLGHKMDRDGKGKVDCFWVNTGRSTQLDGWKTREEIDEYIANPTPLVDKMHRSAIDCTEK